MMKSFLLLSCLLLIFLLTNCKSPTDQINGAFKTVDNSLITSNNNLGDSIVYLYSSIDSNRKSNFSLAQKADSIVSATNSICTFIDSLKNLMQLQDTVGTDITLSRNIFMESNAGDVLKEKFLSAYSYSISPMTTELEKHSFDSCFSTAKDLRLDNWKALFFDNTPTVAALTLLSKFQSDCKNGATLALRKINSTLTK